MLIAHKDGDQTQALDDHLIQVAKYCRRIGKSYQLEALMTLIGLLHDLGKSSSNFQEYIKGSKHQHVNHSSAGGKFLSYLEEENKSVWGYVEVMQYVIYAHHGLFDIVHNTEDIMERRYNYDQDGRYDFEGEILPYAKQLNQKAQAEFGASFSDLFEQGAMEFKQMTDRLANLTLKTESKHSKNSLHYYVHCLVRLCLSILKEGDVHDSATWFLESPLDYQTQEERQALWTTYTQRVEKKVQAFEKVKHQHPLNYWRSEFSDQLLKQSQTHEQGIYQLSLPTGAGKTVASLRYAVHSAKKHRKHHIYYVTSFLSVLEQNAQVIKDFLEDDYPFIYEHHSNITPGSDHSYDEDQTINRRELLLNAWDAPFTITTMVQFFNSMFKGRSDNLRRFHQLGHSVIILDEVQTLPIKVLAHFNLMMNFISEIMESTIILCTATQPMLNHEDMVYPINYSYAHEDQKEMINLSSEAQKTFKRVQAINLIDQSSPSPALSSKDLEQLIREDINQHQSILVIVNTKKAAQKLWEEVDKTDQAKVYYLTTNLCAAHRQDLFEQIKDHLDQLHAGNEQTPLIVVSTQLIEAGVDLDFEIVYRSLAGIDSIIQAAGRCNRNGHHDQGWIKLFQSADENIQSLPEINQAQKATAAALRKAGILSLHQTFDINQLIDPYYQKYYLENIDQMTYNTTNTQGHGIDLLDLLSVNELARLELSKQNRESALLAQGFATAAQSFQLIESDLQTVIVPYKNQPLIDQLRKAMETYDYERLPLLLAQLQPYTIQVQSIADIYNYAESYLDESIWILQPEYYDQVNHLGLRIEAAASFIL